MAVSLLDHPDIRRLRRNLAADVRVEPSDSVRRAAVALVLRASPAGEPELLFIKRAEYEGDPWSGHVAFPGGRREASDASLEQTAIRETREETGIDLATQAEIIGELDEIRPMSVRLPELVVRPYVAVLKVTPTLTLTSEVASAFWLRLELLQDSKRWRDADVLAGEKHLTRRAFHHEGHVIWGITERIIAGLLEKLAAGPGSPG